jgi:hypothetical protein
MGFVRTVTRGFQNLLLTLPKRTLCDSEACGESEKLEQKQVLSVLLQLASVSAECRKLHKETHVGGFPGSPPPTERYEPGDLLSLPTPTGTQAV